MDIISDIYRKRRVFINLNMGKDFFKFLLYAGLFILLYSNLLFSQVKINLKHEKTFGDFQNARSFSIDGQNNLYISDIGYNKIFKYSTDSRLVCSIGGYGWDQLTFDKPVDLTISFGINLYVCDYGNHRIQRFDRNLNFISTYFTRDNDDPAKRFGFPSGCVITNKGELFFIDGENNRIVKLNSFFEYEKCFGDLYSGLGRLEKPVKIRTEGNKILVLDEKSIFIFDGFGNYLKNIYITTNETSSSFSILKDNIFILTPDGINIYNESGNFHQKIQKGELTAINESETLQDIIITGDNAYLLSDKKVYIFMICYTE